MADYRVRTHEGVVVRGTFIRTESEMSKGWLEKHQSTFREKYFFFFVSGPLLVGLGT